MLDLTTHELVDEVAGRVLSVKILDSMVKGTWRKGYVPEVPELEPSRVIRDPERIGEHLGRRLG